MGEPEMSRGERAWDQIRSRPLVLIAVVVMVGVIAAMAARVTEASQLPIGGFAAWVLTAALGFGPPVQVGLLIVALLLLIDRLSGEPFGGQALLFWIVGVLALAGLVVNPLATIETLRMSPIAFGATKVEGWTIEICGRLVPTVLAFLSGWLALEAIDPFSSRGGSSR